MKRALRAGSGAAARTVRCEHGRGAQRQQPDHRTDLQATSAAVRQPQDVVEEPVLLVPHLFVVQADPVHRPGDPEEVLQELLGHILVARIVARQLDGDLQHVLAEQRHPGGPVGLFEVAARRQRRAPVEHADVVEPEEAALEHVVAARVFAVNPPREVHQQAAEHLLQEGDVPVPSVQPLHEVDSARGPGVHRRVDVAEVPLVGRQLTARMQVLIGQHQAELLLGEIGVHQRQRKGVEREVPGREPRILPLVRHRDDVGDVHVEPLPIADHPALPRPHRMGIALIQPDVEVVIVVLLAPEHPGQRLAHHAGLVFAGGRRRDRGVELVGLGATLAQHGLEVVAQRITAVERRAEIVEPQPNRRRSAALDGQTMVRGHLGAAAVGVHGADSPPDHVLVDAILDVRRPVWLPVQALAVRLVLGEQQRHVVLAGEVPVADRLVPRLDDRALAASVDLPQGRPRVAGPPGVAEPERRQQVQLGRCVAAIVGCDRDQDVVRAGLRVLDDDVEVAVVVEDAGVEELVLRLLTRAPAGWSGRDPSYGKAAWGYL